MLAAIFSFGYRLDHPISFFQQSRQIGSQNKSCNYSAEGSSGCVKVEDIRSKCVVTLSFKIVIVIDPLEGSTNHRVAKMPRPVEFGDS